MSVKERFRESIFSIHEGNFTDHALSLFHYQVKHNRVYGDFVYQLGVKPNQVLAIQDIPFLPVEFFKNHEVITLPKGAEPTIFRSSGTTGTHTSQHVVYQMDFYNKSSEEAFKRLYGELDQYVIFALLPAYLDRPDSSLVFMMDNFIKKGLPGSGFYNKDLGGVAKAIEVAKEKGLKVFLMGVTFALLDLAEQFPMDLKGHVVMETGGMKGRRKEMVREELHGILTEAFHVQNIHSEYGMTELLSQGYSHGNGIFRTPPWMKVILRDANDPMMCSPEITSGGVNVIDLANIDSCAFIATQDLGKMHENGSFEILGRFDHADVRGCNLMYV